MGFRQKSLSKPDEVNEQEDLSSNAASRKTSKAARMKKPRPVRVASPTPTLKAVLKAPPSPAKPLAQVANPDDLAAQKVEEAKQSLGNLESEVISALFPATGLPQSFEEVATRLGMTVSEVKDIADNALRGLRGPKQQSPRISTVWN
jgi:DNA-directed RNA polymerase sigma subunit (sigma70/sigma32)